MATVTLDRQKAEKGELPRVCARCGQPATTLVETSFAYKRTWLPVPSYLKPFTLKWVTVKLPFCEAHKAIWFWDRVNMVGVGLALLVVLYVSNEIRKDRGVIPTLIFYGGLVLVIAVLVVLTMTTIRASEMTDTQITLKGVANQFANAVEGRRTGQSASGKS